MIKLAINQSTRTNSSSYILRLPNKSANSFADPEQEEELAASSRPSTAPRRSMASSASCRLRIRESRLPMTFERFLINCFVSGSPRFILSFVAARGSSWEALYPNIDGLLSQISSALSMSGQTILGAMLRKKSMAGRSLGCSRQRVECRERK